MDHPQGADIALVIRHDDVVADSASEVSEQCCTIDRRRPRLWFWKRNRVSLLAVIRIEPKLRALGRDQAIEDRGTHAQFLGRTLALMLVLDRR
jgi:hypothetical protein